MFLQAIVSIVLILYVWLLTVTRFSLRISIQVRHE